MNNLNIPNNPSDQRLLLEINQEARQFFTSQDKVHSLEHITELFTKLQGYDEKLEAIEICLEKVFNYLSPNDFKSSDEAVLERTCLKKILGDNSPLWLEQLVQIDKIMRGKDSDNDKFQKLKTLCDQYSKNENSEFHNILELAELVTRTVSMSSEEKITLLTLLINNEVDLNKCPFNYLSHAVKNEEKTLINFLLEKGVNLFKPDWKLGAPLFVASSLKDDAIFNNLCSLIEAKCSLILLTPALEKIKNAQHFERLIQILDITDKDWTKNATNLLVGILNNPLLTPEEKLDRLIFLKEKGCSLKETSNFNLLAIAYENEIKEEDKKIFTFLLDEGLDIHKTDKLTGSNPLQLIIKNEDKKMIIHLTNTRQIKFDPEALKKGINLTSIKFGAPQKTIAINLLKTDLFKGHKVFSDKLTHTKLVSHSFSIGGKGVISKKKIDINLNEQQVPQEEMIKLEGTAGPYKGYEELAKNIDINKKNVNNLKSEECQKALKFSSENPSSKELLKRFETKEWTLIPTGYKNHAVTVVLKKDALGPGRSLFVICNRGEGQGLSKTPVESFFFNGNNPEILLTMIEKMRAVKGSIFEQTNAEDTLEAYKSLMFDEIPKALNLQKSKETEEHNLNCQLENQTVGNCTYASGEMAAKMMIYFDTSKGKIFSQKDTVDTEFEKLRCMARLEHLEKYLSLHQKKEFPYKLDYTLVRNALSILWSSSIVEDPSIIKELKKVEEKFMNLLEKDDLLIYKTSKSFQLTYHERLKTGNLKNIDEKNILYPLMKRGLKMFELLENNFLDLKGVERIKEEINNDFKDFSGQLDIINNAFGKRQLMKITDKFLKEINQKYQFILKGLSLLKDLKKRLIESAASEIKIQELEKDIELFISAPHSKRQSILSEIQKKYR